MEDSELSVLPEALNDTEYNIEQTERTKTHYTQTLLDNLCCILQFHMRYLDILRPEDFSAWRQNEDKVIRLRLAVHMKGREGT